MATDYFASPTGLSGNSGLTDSDTWDIRTALANSLQGASDTLWLRGGTYTGKSRSTLMGGTVRSYPGEWAVLDGHQTATLVGSINSTATTFELTSTGPIYNDTAIAIDNEVIAIRGLTGSVGAGYTVTDSQRHYNGTTAASHTAGATVTFAGNVLQLEGAAGHTTYRDFEVCSSDPDRNLAAKYVLRFTRGDGIVIVGSIDSTKLVNLHIHDCTDGAFVGSGTSNTEIYGCLVNNNGLLDTGGAGYGHGFYMENASGYSRVYANILVNNFNFNDQSYGVTGPYVGGDHRNNAMANAGSPRGAVLPSTRRSNNFVYGPDSVQSPTGSIIDSYFWAPMDAVGGGPASVGYGAGVAAMVFNGNIVVGGPNTMGLGLIGSVSGSGNKIQGKPDGVPSFMSKQAATTGTWNGNEYHGVSSGRTIYNIEGGAGLMNFAAWKSATGWDASSTETSSVLPDTVAVVPNDYEPGRANIIMFLQSRPLYIDVDLSSTGLVHGQTYTIKNAFDYLGGVVSSGVYDENDPIDTLDWLDMLGVAEPTGLGFTPATTAPDFAALIVEPIEAAASASISGGVRLAGGVTVS